MSSLAEELVLDASEQALDGGRPDYIPMISQAMIDSHLPLRALALKTGISKSRLGLLLHRDAAKRPNMSLVEFQTILNAVGLSVIQAVIRVETIRDQALLRDERYATSFALLGSVFQDLPAKLIEALEELEGIDGSEIRQEWAEPLLAAVVERVVRAVTEVQARRAAMFGKGSFKI